MPDSEELRAEAETWTEIDSTQLFKLDAQQSPDSGNNPSEVDGQALLQNVGLRTSHLSRFFTLSTHEEQLTDISPHIAGVGRVFLEWAGETIKQSLVTAAAAKTSANQPFAGAGIELASRLVDAIIV